MQWKAKKEQFLRKGKLILQKVKKNDMIGTRSGALRGSGR